MGALVGCIPKALQEVRTRRRQTDTDKNRWVGVIFLIRLRDNQSKRPFKATSNVGGIIASDTGQSSGKSI
jgi:hypothetical protein